MQPQLLTTFFICISAVVLCLLASAIQLAHNKNIDRSTLTKQLTQRMGIAIVLLIMMSLCFFTVWPMHSQLSARKTENNEPYNISAHKKTQWPNEIPMRA